MERNRAYGKLVRHLFLECLRLSIHPSSNIRKVGVNLVGPTSWGTPWHNCALHKKDGEWVLIRKNEAEKRNYRLVDDGLLPYFEEI
jgi:pyoverdine/dityrosine biosynthesis protein Dit1